MMKIGNTTIEHGLFLGPMAGVTDMVYRQLCVEQGCDVTCTEMVSAKAIYYNNKKTEQLMTIHPTEKLGGVQLFGREPQLLADMAKRIDHDGIRFFDVNMGCPVPKVVNNGEGSALMKEPELIGEIIRLLVKATDKPVSIKIRSGFSPDDINAVLICKIAEANGANHVTIHARTREQYYSGKANWDVIKAAKAAVLIPIIGNGDITDKESLLNIKEYTGCDGFMIGRAAMGNPWIFNELRSAFEGVDYTRPSTREVRAMILRHSELLIEHKGEVIAMKEMRKHVGWYSKGMKHAAFLREGMNHLERYEDLVKLLALMD